VQGLQIVMVAAAVSFEADSTISAPAMLIEDLTDEEWDAFELAIKDT
jgi:hypothetical protein